MSRAGSVASDPAGAENGLPWPGETQVSGLMKGLPNIKIRTFAGDREDYEDWRREVEALQALYGVAEAKLALLVYLALEPGPSNPRDLLHHLSIKNDIAVE
eukprot:3832377-Amphidinium_carterae.1